MTQIPEFDNLYLDMNGIIHVCSHPEDDNPHFRITEEKIFADIMYYIEVSNCSVKKNVKINLVVHIFLQKNIFCCDFHEYTQHMRHNVREPTFGHAPSKDLDQTLHSHSLIIIFTGRILDSKAVS